LGNLEWQPLYPKPEVSSAAVMATYRDQFPELWHNHDLIVEVTHRQKLLQDEVDAIAPGTLRTGPTLRLFVSGHSSFTEQILKTLQQVLDNSRHRPYSLKVIDVSKHPEQAEADQITATPTLVRVWPTPVRRLVGELDDPQAILWLLADA
jgi:circadian clock protein KaiB